MMLSGLQTCQEPGRRQDGLPPQATEVIIRGTQSTSPVLQTVQELHLKQDGRSSMATEVATMCTSSASLLGAMTTMLGRQAM